MPFAPRSLLFVSAETPDRFAKAAGSGADMVCIDLEDAVRADRKDAARQAAIAYTGSSTGPVPLAIRINALDTRYGLDDLRALLDSGVSPDALLLPKLEHARDLVLVSHWLGANCPALVALIESPLGVENLPTIAAARTQVPQLTALMLGGADLSLELGARFEWQTLFMARSRLVNAASVQGLQAWDVPHIDLQDLDGLESETRAAHRMGFDCKCTIHPAQLARVHQAFQPSDDELRHARSIVEAAGEHHRGAFMHEGRMIDEPILLRARLLIERTDDTDDRPPTYQRNRA